MAANARVSFVPSYSLPSDSGVGYEDIDGVLLASFTKSSKVTGYELAKRACDVVLVCSLKKAFLVLLLSTPLGFGQLAEAQAENSAEQEARAPASSSMTVVPECGSGRLVPGEDPQNNLGFHFLKHLGCDQAQFWSSSKNADKSWKILAPAAGATAMFIASDSWLSKQIPDKPQQLKRSRDFSNYATASLIGVGGGAFVLGHLTDNDHLKETGLLSGEAALNSTGVAYLLKEITQRPRPYQADGNGQFFQGGTSFPSEHAAVAWSVASVLAHEYPGTLTQVLSYGLAAGITATRVTSQQHFASDAIIGSALGWYFGRQVYKAHHDPNLGGAGWGNILPESSGEKTGNPKNMGSPYVPIDSWIYPALERLAAMGYIKTAYLGMRPWTRLECARMLDEAQQNIADADDQSSQAARVYSELAEEFSTETGRLNGAANVDANIDSIYTRFEGISGPPLRDGFHFASTIVNDYGRPYAEGFNNVSGLSAHASAGNFFASVQGEYQNAGSSPSEPLSALQLIAAGEDGTPALPNAVKTMNRLRLLDSSAGFTFGGFQISAGKESLWLGPGVGGPFLFSDNAEPITMVRVERVSPAEIPWLSRIFGPIRTEFAIGRVAGTEWVLSQGKLFGPTIGNQPFVHVEKISFKPTENFEFGMGVSALFGGPGSPVTFGNFLKTFSVRCSVGTCSRSLAAENYGDRRSTVDLSYRLPHLRNWVTVYADSFVEDEISPIGSSRPALRLGVYLPKVPKLNKMELRMESAYTDAPNTVFVGNYYSNSHYISGYTNYGTIMGSWIGRAGKGGQAWATYWFSPRSSIRLQYRREVVSKRFLAGGGLNDFGLQAEFKASSSLALQSFLQYESWDFPALAPSAKSDVTASLQLTFYPHWNRSK